MLLKRREIRKEVQYSCSCSLARLQSYELQFFGAKSAPDSDDDVPPMLMLQLLLLLLLLWGSASLANF